MPDSITISSPVQFQAFQRSGNAGDILIVGTYGGSEGLETVEARHAENDWSLIDASPSGGTFSGTLNAPTGSGTLDVRFSTSTGITDSVTDISLAEVFVIIGQSNAEGRATNGQVYSGSLGSTMFRQDSAWAVLSDPSDSDTSKGSPWPLLANYLESYLSMPIAFVTAADGSGSLGTAAEPGDWHPDGVGNHYANAVSQYGVADTNGCAGLLYHQGETDVNNGVSREDYKTSLGALASQALIDFSAPLLIAQLQYKTTGGASRENMDAIRWAQRDAWEDTAFPNALIGPVLFQESALADGVHFATDSELAFLAERWFAAIASSLYGDLNYVYPHIVRILKTDSSTYHVVFQEDIDADSWDASAWRIGDGSIAVTDVQQSSSNVLLLTTSADFDGEEIALASFNDGSGQVVPYRSASIPTVVSDSMLHASSSVLVDDARQFRYRNVSSQDADIHVVLTSSAAMISAFMPYVPRLCG